MKLVPLVTVCVHGDSGDAVTGNSQVDLQSRFSWSGLETACHLGTDVLIQQIWPAESIEVIVCIH